MMPTGTTVPLSIRVLLFVGLASTAAVTSIWRAASGHHFLPGLFTVIFLPVSLVLFITLDRRAHFGVAEWTATMSLVAVHLVLSVPGRGGPLYYRGSHLVRPDHFVHVFAGGLVAWLASHLLLRVRPELSRRWLPAAAFAMAIGFGAMKETTDFLSVQAAGLRHDSFDSIVDFCANAIGAAAAVWWFVAVMRPSSMGHVATTD